MHWWQPATSRFNHPRKETMKTIEEMEHHPVVKKLTEILAQKTQNPNVGFFRVQVAYYLAMCAAMMRTKIVTPDRGEIPVNVYALNLGTSGSGKGYSTNVLEQQVVRRFRTRFMEETFPLVAEKNLPGLATKRASRKGTDPDEELVRVQKEFDSCGPLLASFDSGTGPAIKQLRHKLLMAQAGSMNLQIDEIGSNLSANLEILEMGLELYDVGEVKPKLVKNTTDNSRSEEIIGRTPMNVLMFGTPSKLLDGAKTESDFYSLLETGYARRCLFGFSKTLEAPQPKTPEEIFKERTDKSGEQFLDKLADRLEDLADMVNIDKRLVISEDTVLKLISYELQCIAIADRLPEHEEVKKAEIRHRYFKALKLAGAYAFVDQSPEVTADHLYNAIKLVEESGAEFHDLLTRDRPYVKLAKYIANVGKDITQADLVEDLPFYRGATSQKTEMMTLAIAYGYKNNIIIKKSFSDGIEFFRGETLKASDLGSMILSYSTDMTEGYLNERAPFDQLHKLVQATGYHWLAHHLVGGHESKGYRLEENALPGFNMIVIDVDATISLGAAKSLLKDFKFLVYTTKRHTPEANRFRIIMPINYELKMDAKDYKEFMKNIFEWLPFEVDEQTGQRAKKWLAHSDEHSICEYNDGEQLFDALPFIPKTSKNEERKRKLESQQDMDNLERWVMNNIGDGNRNNMLLRYSMILVDAGFSLDKIQEKVVNLNDKLMDKLEEAEIYSTIMKTVMNAVAKRGT
jgi:hypothetical protein